VALAPTQAGVAQWALAFKQYCHHQYCVVYSIQKEDRGRSVPGSGWRRTLRSSLVMPLQQSGHCRWGGRYIHDRLVHKSVEANEYLVNAKVGEPTQLLALARTQNAAVARVRPSPGPSPGVAPPATMGYGV